MDTFSLFMLMLVGRSVFYCCPKTRLDPVMHFPENVLVGGDESVMQETPDPPTRRNKRVCKFGSDPPHTYCRCSPTTVRNTMPPRRCVSMNKTNKTKKTKKTNKAVARRKPNPYAMITSEEIGLAYLQANEFNALSWDPSGSRLAVAADGAIAIWDTVVHEWARTESYSSLPQHAQYGGSIVTAVAWSPNGRWIVSGSSKGAIYVWDAETGAVAPWCRQRFLKSAHSASVKSVAWSPCSTMIVSCASVSMRPFKIGDKVQCRDDMHELNSKWYDGVVESVDPRITVKTADYSKAQEWDSVRFHYTVLSAHTHTQAERQTMNTWTPRVIVLERGPIRDLGAQSTTSGKAAWSPDGTMIAWVGGLEDSEAVVWVSDIATGMNLYMLKGHTSTVYSVAWSPDGTRIASGSRDKTVRVWNAATGAPVLGGPLEGHDQEVLCVAWSPDGTMIASGSEDMTVRIWDTSNGQPLSEPFEGHTDAVLCVAWSPDGSKIASGSFDKTVRIWDVAWEDGDSIPAPDNPLEGHQGWVMSLAWSPDGSKIISGSYDKTVRMWNSVTGQPLNIKHNIATSRVLTVAWSLDGTMIAVGQHDGTVRVWNMLTGKNDLIMEGHTLVHSVAWLPGGTRIASLTDMNMTVHTLSHTYQPATCIWSAGTGKRLLTFDNIQENALITLPVSVAWSKNNEIAVAGDRIFNGRRGTGQRVHIRKLSPQLTWTNTWKIPFHERVNTVAFSPRGDRFVVGCGSGLLRVWDNMSKRTDALIYPNTNPNTNPNTKPKPNPEHDLTFQVHGDVRSISWSPDGHHFAVYTNFYIRIIDILKQVIQPLGNKYGYGLRQCSGTVAWSPDSSTIAVVAREKDNTLLMMRIGDAYTGRRDDKQLRNTDEAAMYVPPDDYKGFKLPYEDLNCNNSVVIDQIGAICYAVAAMNLAIKDATLYSSLTHNAKNGGRGDVDLANYLTQLRTKRRLVNMAGNSTMNNADFGLGFYSEQNKNLTKRTTAGTGYTRLYYRKFWNILVRKGRVDHQRSSFGKEYGSAHISLQAMLSASLNDWVDTTILVNREYMATNPIYMGGESYMGTNHTLSVNPERIWWFQHIVLSHIGGYPEVSAVTTLLYQMFRASPAGCTAIGGFIYIPDHVFSFHKCSTGVRFCNWGKCFNKDGTSVLSEKCHHFCIVHAPNTTITTSRRQQTRQQSDLNISYLRLAHEGMSNFVTRVNQCYSHVNPTRQLGGGHWAGHVWHNYNDKTAPEVRIEHVKAAKALVENGGDTTCSATTGRKKKCRLRGTYTDGKKYFCGYHRYIPGGDILKDTVFPDTVAELLGGRHRLAKMRKAAARRKLQVLQTNMDDLKAQLKAAKSDLAKAQLAKMIRKLEVSMHALTKLTGQVDTPHPKNTTINNVPVTRVTRSPPGDGKPHTPLAYPWHQPHRS